MGSLMAPVRSGVPLPCGAVVVMGFSSKIVEDQMPDREPPALIDLRCQHVFGGDEPLMSESAGRQQDQQRVAFLGLGTMGGPMAANIARRGFPTTVWNRSP